MASEENVCRPADALPLRLATREFLEDCPPRIAEMFHYWDGLRRDRRMPQRADFDPEDVVRHLPGILLVDVEGLDADGVGIYRYRLVGTDEVNLRGHDPTGKLIRDGFFWISLEEAVAAYEAIRISRSYSYQAVDFVSAEGRRCCQNMIVLPFSEDGSTVSQILIYSMTGNSQ